MVAAQRRHRRDQPDPAAASRQAVSELPVVVVEYCGYSGSSSTSSGSQSPDRARRLVAERVPVAHGDEAARVEVRQGRFQRARLLLGQFQQRRSAAEDRRSSRVAALARATGDDPGEEGADEERHPQDGGVREQVDQERLDRLRAVRARRG